MASKEVEVLDPEVAIENVKRIASGAALNRRHFMAALGVAGAVAGTELVSGPTAKAQQPTPSGYSQIDVLNFLLNVKYLKATFLSYVTQGVDLPAASGVTTGTGAVYNQPTKITFGNQQITDLFNEMYYDDLNQLIALRNLLGTAAAGRQTVNLLGTSAVNTTFAAPPTTTTISQSQAIALCRVFADLSVQAFAGASSYLTGTNLSVASQVLATDGFHAGALRLLTIQTGATYQGMQYLTTFQAGTYSGSSTVYAMAPSPAPVAGDALAGTNIPEGAIITAVTAASNKTPTGILVSGNPQVNTVSSVSGLAPGQPITGTNIPALTVITAVGTNTITLSNNPTASTTVKPTGVPASASTVITGVSSLTGVAVGQPITGTNIPANTTITATNSSASTITISNAATATSTLSLTGIVAAGSNVIANASTTTGVVVGQPISGTGIPSSATVIAAGGGTITLSTNASGGTTVSPTGILTSGSNVITSVSSTKGIFTGQPIGGSPNIPSGTLITAIGTSTITMSNNATGTSSAAETLSTPTTETVTTPTSVTLTIPSAVTLTIGVTSLTLSLAASATGGTQATVVTSDSFDVAPADNGSNSASGPQTVANSSPTIYQGFFDTAGSGTSSANNPAGFAFARNFSQVLSVLYTSTATGTYEGGFYPVGVTGSINVV